MLLVGLVATVARRRAGALTGGTPLLASTLFLAGASAASTNAASGRVVVGWFPPERRGLAMGIRQMAQPLGVAVAAVTIAVVADAHGSHAALWVPAVAARLAVRWRRRWSIDPPRPAPRRAAHRNPYRGRPFLARIHGVSVLLVVPQFLVWTVRAGLAGAGPRLVRRPPPGRWSRSPRCSAPSAGSRVGHLSDLVGSRMRPLRWVALAAAATMALLGPDRGRLASPSSLIVVASTVTVADNGLAFTAVAERAGPFWSGRALGLQNTASSSPPQPSPPSRDSSPGRGTPRRSPPRPSSPSWLSPGPGAERADAERAVTRPPNEARRPLPGSAPPRPPSTVTRATRSIGGRASSRVRRLRSWPARRSRIHQRHAHCHRDRAPRSARTAGHDAGPPGRGVPGAPVRPSRSAAMP